MAIVEDTQAQSVPSEPSLVGNIDVSGLVNCLTKITDMSSFKSAITNLRSGDEVTMTQKEQLALAFVSILGADQVTRQKAIVLMQGLHAPSAMN